MMMPQQPPYAAMTSGVQSQQQVSQTYYPVGAADTHPGATQFAHDVAEYDTRVPAQPYYATSQPASYGAADAKPYDALASEPQNLAQSDQPPAAADAAAAAEPVARWSWSMYPTSRLDGARMVIPLGCIYTPLAHSCRTLTSMPVRCRHCAGVLNPYAELSTQTNGWRCLLCEHWNSFPVEYGQYVAAQQVPPEAMSGNETVEYVALNPTRVPPTFAFVVDTCVDTEDELTGLKEFLTLTLQKIPEYANVCFITYGATVNVHQLSRATSMPRCLVLRGTQDVSAKALEAMLGDVGHYVGPVTRYAEAVAALIEQLTGDLWIVEKDYRPPRCTGAALAVAAGVLQLVSPNAGSSVLAFISGVCTSGPGIVVDTSREHMIRSHTDIRDGTSTASYWAASCDFYDGLMKRLVQNGHALNCFTASLDQLGIAEMKQCIQASGGVVLNAESWLQEPFRLSLDSFFARRQDGVLRMGLNVTFEVITSPTWKVQGVIGQCVGTGKRSSSVADYSIGFGDTCEWTTCMLDPTSSFAIYYDASPSSSEATRRALRYTQIVTRYEMGQELRTRVTTLCHRQQDNPSVQDLAAAFDQETAVVLLARQAVFKTDSTPLFDVLRWLDRTLVRLVSRFGTFTPNVAESLQLPPNFVFFPAFIYHLRRSGYLQVFNSSPDESAIIRLQLLKSPVADSIVQIQPTLYSYRLDAPPQPVALDSTAIQADNILLLDTFFEVLVHYGSAIAAWKKAGYAEQEEYAYLREFLEIPLADAQLLVSSRYPMPRLIEVSQDDPDARILYNRINPSRSYANAGPEMYGANEGELVYTDDASLQMFMDHLKKLAVAQ